MLFPQFRGKLGLDVIARDTSALADEPQCGDTGTVTDVHFGGSWKDDILGTITISTLGFWSVFHDPDGAGLLGSCRDSSMKEV